MKAIIKSHHAIECIETEKPRISSPFEVLVQVYAAGICRTDLRIAYHPHPLTEQRILGHEFSGIVVEKGAQVSELEIGDRVTAHPEKPCGQCPTCLSGHVEYCQTPHFLGLDRDGAFAEFICLHANQCYTIPRTLDFVKAAYTEPFAAGLAAVNHGIEQNWQVLIDGNNRFAGLIQKILNAHGVNRVDFYLPELAEDYPQHAYDMIIETGIRQDFIEHFIPYLKKRGPNDSP